MRLAIFASGNGSNFEILAKEVATGCLHSHRIACLICDNPKAYVIERAKQYKIPTYVIQPKDYPSKAAYERAILEKLAQEKVEFIVLAGYMRIIGPTLLTPYSQKIINIHPALLPQFPGRQGIQDAFDSQVAETGVTIHFVDQGIDTGPIIAQKKVKIAPNDTLETLETKIHQVEHDLYPKVLAQVLAD